ncbi:MAG: 5-(carboxyamino)imidazole ribonucleotide mutase [Clostridiales bacterium]|jgi:5-(carboxyamino)imidazole ribonucleotide mutase|nr:5-(carboxyamino)imidazole ribonucleotide mutase [Clostridiales bacterium]
MNTPVAIIIGSDSDWPMVKKAFETLKAFEVGCDVQIMSAHRTPERVKEYVQETSVERGVKVFISAAGKAAHLPGVIAAHTLKPVIGLPVRGVVLDGMDALFSIVQMPSGVPVAAVAIDGAENAALLAVQILALDSPELSEKLSRHRLHMAQSVAEKNTALRDKLYEK